MGMIYYLEDDKNIRDLVVYTLNKSGFPTVGFQEGGELFSALEDETAELILLDIMLPGEDGLSILKRLRESSRTKDIPVIMITAKGTEYDKVVGLDLGADDYITKPFGIMELTARVNARLRRSGKQEEAGGLEAGKLKVSREKHMAWVDGKPVILTHKEFDLLIFLLENKGLVFNRERLLEAIWGYDYLGGTRTVDVHIQTLRQKLAECGAYIQTIRGVGYKVGDIDND